MADVCDDGLIFHPLHVLQRDHVNVAARGDVNVATAQRVFDSGDLVAFHRRLQRVDRIDLGNDNARTLAAQRLRAALADVAVAANNGDFSGKHDVQRAIQSIDEGMPAAVEIVELRLGD